MQSGFSEVESFLTKQGLNSQSILEGTKGVTSKAEEAINYASPTVKSTAGTLSATNPQLLAKYALGLAAVYYLVSPWWTCWVQRCPSALGNHQSRRSSRSLAMLVQKLVTSRLWFKACD